MLLPTTNGSGSNVDFSLLSLLWIVPHAQRSRPRTANGKAASAGFSSSTYIYIYMIAKQFSVFFSLVKDDNQKKEGRIETTYRAMTLNGRKLFLCIHFWRCRRRRIEKRKNEKKNTCLIFVQYFFFFSFSFSLTSRSGVDVNGATSSFNTRCGLAGVHMVNEAKSSLGTAVEDEAEEREKKKELCWAGNGRKKRRKGMREARKVKSREKRE